MIRNRGIFKWLTLDMVIFVAVNFALIYCFADKLAALRSVTFFELLVLGLAAYRAANIVSSERVTKPLRAPFVDEVQKQGKAVEKPKKYGFLGAIGLLIYCASCTGVWLAAAIVYSYMFWPEPTFLIVLILALSAIERIVSSILGWFRSNT